MDPDDLPPVIQSPIVRTVKAKFVHEGKWEPLPMPDESTPAE